MNKSEDSLEEWQDARAEALADLNGSHRSLAEADTDFRRRHNLPPPTQMTADERADRADAILAALPPEKVAEAERLGLL